jgi:putative hydrolase of the HAD superfamily
VIRAVICDFGGVLTTPLGNAFAAWSKESGVALEDLGSAMAAAAEEHGEHPLFMLERGELTEHQFLDRLQRALGERHDLTGMFDVWFGFLERNPEMIELMASLRDRGLRMALLTNNVREWEPRWRPMLPEIDDIFEVVVDSGFVGMRKPERPIYELTLERLGGVAAAECLFVDDMELNCDAARELGMTVVRFEDTAQARTEIEAALAGGGPPAPGL